MAITSISQLKKSLERRIQMALTRTQKEIYDVVYDYIKQFYKDPAFSPPDVSTPDVYVRTWKFLNSLIKTDVVVTGSNISCSVQLSDDYLEYKYPGNPDWNGNVPATGLDVATWANEHGNDHTHGYTVSGTSSYVPWWDGAMKELGGKQGILNIMKKNLKAVGIPLSK